MYDRILDEVESNGDLVTLSGDSAETKAYMSANDTILAEALALGQDSKQDMRAVLVWDCAPRGEDDLTKLFGDEANARGFTVVEIKTA